MFSRQKRVSQGEDKMIIPTMFPKRWGTTSFERKGLSCSKEQLPKGRRQNDNPNHVPQEMGNNFFERKGLSNFPKV